MNQKPSIGRVVHFFDEELAARLRTVRSGPYAAMITSIPAGPSGSVNLSRIVGPDEVPSYNEAMMNVPYGGDDGKDEGSGHPQWWVWPERV